MKKIRTRKRPEIWLIFSGFIELGYAFVPNNGDGVHDTNGFVFFIFDRRNYPIYTSDADCRGIDFNLDGIRVESKKRLIEDFLCVSTAD